jgi:hypothetical protein
MSNTPFQVYGINNFIKQFTKKKVLEKWFIEILPETGKQHFYEFEVAIMIIPLVKTIYLLQKR